jgi:hypothetical protein
MIFDIKSKHYMYIAPLPSYSIALPIDILGCSVILTSAAPRRGT